MASVMNKQMVLLAALALTVVGCKRVSSDDDKPKKQTPQMQVGTSGSGSTGKPTPSTPTTTTPPAVANTPPTTAGTAPTTAATAPTALTKKPGTAPAKAPATGKKPPVSKKAMAEAAQIFRSRCATCHGVSGRGNGPVAKALNPKPRDYSDRKWQAKTSDKTIATAIVKGGPAVGLKALMPPNADLEQKPEVVRGLVQIIRSFAAKKKPAKK